MYLGLSTDSELVLVQQMCELCDVQLQELIQFVDFSEVQLEEVLSCCLQLGTVHTVCQGGNTCRGMGQGSVDSLKANYELIGK